MVMRRHGVGAQLEKGDVAVKECFSDIRKILMKAKGHRVKQEL